MNTEQSNSKKNSKESNHASNSSRERQKKTAITLSVITCVFMCIMGYEIMRDNQATAETEPAVRADQRPIFFNKIAENNDNNESEMSRQIKLLTVQNRVQSQKIRDLKEELQDAARRLHEIQITLLDKKQFVTVAKIDDLQQQLILKDRHNQELLDKIVFMETELTDNRRKVHQMELTVDSLASMIDTQRATKDQDLQHYNNQLTELQRETDEERFRLITAIHQYEERVNQIHEELEQKSHYMAQLERDLTQQNELVAGKTKEMESLTLSHNHSHEQLNTYTEQLATFENTLKEEKEKAHQLENELNLAKINYLEEQQKALHLQEQLDQAVIRVAELEKEVSEKQEIVASLGNTHAQSESEMNFQINHLKEELDQEQGKALALLDELNVLINHYEGEQQTTFELEKKLRHIERELAHKQQALTFLSDSNVQLIEENKHLNGALVDKSASQSNVEQALSEYQQQVASLIHGIQVEALIGQSISNHSQEQLDQLNHHLAHASQREDSHKDELQSILAEKEASENQLKDLEAAVNTHREKSENLEKELIAHQENLQAKDQKIDEMRSLDSQLQALGEELEKEKVKSLAIEDELDQLRAKYQVENEIVLEIDFKMHALQAQLSEKENALKDKENALAQKEEEMQKLSSLNQDLIAENRLLLQSEVDKTAANVQIAEETEKKISDLESNSRVYADKAMHLEEELNLAKEDLVHQHSEMADLRKTLEEFSGNKEISIDLEHKLQDVNAQLRTKEEEIEKHTASISQLEIDLQTAQQVYQNKQLALENLTQSMTLLGEENKKVKENEEHLAEILKEQEKENALINDKASQLEAELAKTRDDLESEQKEMENLRISLKQFAQSSEASLGLEHKVLELSDHLAAKEEEVAKHSSTISKLEEQFHQSELDYQNQQKELNFLSLSLTKLEAEHELAKEKGYQLEELRRANEQQQETLNEFENKLRHLSSELGEKETTLRLKEERTLLLERELDSLNEKILAHQEEMHGLREEKYRLEKNLADSATGNSGSKDSSTKEPNDLPSESKPEHELPPEGR